MENKIEFFKNLYLDSKGNSNIIKRYELPYKIHWTSGDSIFRMDSLLSKKLKYCTFKKKEIRYSWEPAPDEKDKIELEHRKMDFSEIKTNSVIYLKCYGYKTVVEKIDEGIRTDIRKIIIKKKCVNCFSRQKIECDHKNDLKNDIRVLHKKTQKLEDFQPLCKHCNMIKKTVKQKMLKLNKRIGGTEFGYSVNFIIGNYKLNKSDVDWYKGTYWGDIEAFKLALQL